MDQIRTPTGGTSARHNDANKCHLTLDYDSGMNQLLYGMWAKVSITSSSFGTNMKATILVVFNDFFFFLFDESDKAVTEHPNVREV